MSKYNKLFSLFLLMFTVGINAQECSFKVKGFILDYDTKEALDLVNIYIQELGTGTVSDSTGSFLLEGFCDQEYHFVLSHIGCESTLEHIFISSDTLLTLYLSHSTNLLDEVMITAHNEHSTQISRTINEQTIVDQSEKSLATLLKDIPGVTSINNGSGISKPIVQGLFGNRLTILNNGVAQSGQQWGNDHAPEIDPLVANNIDVLRGSEALSYMGGHFGSVILVEPKQVGRSPHIHGRANYQYNSNGRGHTINFQAQKYSPIIGWKLTSTLKQSGDKKTPTYYLNNTGGKEANFALQLEKQISDTWFADAYISSFNSELGVLRGSHIGNLTDLESAIGREEPFFTEEEFSYQLESPKQRVNHQLAKLQLKNIISEEQVLSLVMSTQFNGRREFDVRRGGRSNIPALILDQWNFFAEASYKQDFKNSWRLKFGLQQQSIDNTNSPETGILPLIPDYISSQSGLFSILERSSDNWVFDFGFRYDFLIQNAVTISNTSPREIVRYNRNFNNYSLSSSFHFDPDEKINFTYNIYHTKRNPAINELYSAGLHQGVSGIEEGNPMLNNETSTSNRLSTTWKPLNNFSLDLGLYSQYILDFIYLAPELEERLTIRGAFPVFKYKQNDAHIYGLDLSSFYELSPAFLIKFQYSYIRGRDLDNGIGLVNIPSNSLASGVEYKSDRKLNILGLALENVSLEVEQEYVFRQENISSDQDFLLPPDAYLLFKIKGSAEQQIKSTRLRFHFAVENLLNTSYRNYLNRQRYYADDLGRNIVIGVSSKF